MSVPVVLCTVTCRHTIDREHIGSVCRISILPRSVRLFVDFSCSMVPLIEGHSYQSFRRRLRRCPSQVFIPSVDSGSCYGSHDSLLLQPRMQQPNTRHIIHIRQLIESVYCRQDARDVIRLGRNRRRVSVVVPVFHWVRSSHGYDETKTTARKSLVRDRLR